MRSNKFSERIAQIKVQIFISLKERHPQQQVNEEGESK